MKYKWIIFDADGTLFDYDLAEISAFKNTFKIFGYSYKDEYLSIYRSCNKQLWDAFEQRKVSLEKLKVQRFELLLQEINIELDAELFSEEYLKQLSKGIDLIDGAENLLRSLSGKIGMILMTNGIKEVQRSRLNLSSIKPYFSDIIISDEVGVAKPDRRIFEIALENISIADKQNILMVGDNLNSDIKGGIDFGIDTCWFNPKRMDINPNIIATYEVSDLGELLTILENN